MRNFSPSSGTVELVRFISAPNKIMVIYGRSKLKKKNMDIRKTFTEKVWHERVKMYKDDRAIKVTIDDAIRRIINY